MGNVSPMLQVIACSMVVTPMVRLAGSSGVFDDLRESVDDARRGLVDKLEEVCLRNLLITREFCSCVCCSMLIARLFGRERDVDSVRTMALERNADVISRVHALLISEDLSNDEVAESVNEIFRSLPWNDILVYRRALMDMRCFVHSDDPGDYEYPARHYD